MLLIVRSLAPVALACASVALAVPAAASDAPQVKKAPDPNEVVCVSEPELGSRLVRHKTCMTRAQWTERARNDRDVVDRSQASRCQQQAGC